MTPGRYKAATQNDCGANEAVKGGNWKTLRWVKMFINKDKVFLFQKFVTLENLFYLCNSNKPNIKKNVMTRTITINKPSPRMIQVFDSLREKKCQQIEKLMKKKECVFTIKV